MTHPLLAIDNLSIAFRQQGETQTVVHNLSLEVAVGETLALVGESGSGKSISALSVLRLLLTPPASYPSGDIRFHGQSLLHADEATLRGGVRGNRIAMIFQEPMVSLNPLHTPGKTALRGAVVTPGNAQTGGARGRYSTAWSASGSVRRRGGWRTIRISSPAASASGDDRHGAADAPGAADRRRADYRPGRIGAGANSATAARAEAGAEHGAAVYHS